jgi:trehalose-6-phosphate synthase
LISRNETLKLCLFHKLIHSILLFFFRFHTYDDARHFVSACTRILGLEGTPEGVEDQGRLIRVAVVNIEPTFLLPTLYMLFK